MKLQVLINNCVHRPGLKAEHGLSLWVEHGGKSFLFDTGSSGLVVDNAHTLDVPLPQAEAIILSHGHYDHTGGLRRVLEDIGRPIRVLAHPDIWRKRAYKDERGIRDIGIPFSERQLERAQFSYNSNPREIDTNIWISGAIPRETEFEQIEPELICLKGDTWVQDDIWDDQAMVINVPQGVVIITGCAHSGIINVIRYGLQIAQNRRLYAVIGGFHLWHASQKRLEQTIEALRNLEPAYIITGHCTGLEAACVLKSFFKEKCIFLDVGLEINL